MHFISFNYVMWIYFETVNILGLGFGYAHV